MVTQVVDYILNAQSEPFMYEQIMEYGCYCHLLDHKLLQGVGEPVDQEKFYFIQFTL